MTCECHYNLPVRVSYFLSTSGNVCVVDVASLLLLSVCKNCIYFFYRYSPVQLDDFDAYFKEMSKDSAYKFSLQFEVRQVKSDPQKHLMDNEILIPKGQE